ncbi:hypothetical protein SAMN05421881_10811, partial [Nitrosomonas halophila]
MHARHWLKGIMLAGGLLLAGMVQANIS